MRNQEIMIGDKTLEEILIENNYDLSGMDLNGYDLRGADLNGVRLQGCSFRNANLEGADLSNADMFKSDFDHAILRRANMSGSNLNESNLYKAELDYAKLVNASMVNANMTDVDFNKSNLRKTDMRKSDMTDSNIGEAYLDRTNFKYSNLSDSDITKERLNDSRLKDTNLENTELEKHIEKMRDLHSKQSNLKVIDAAVQKYATMNGENANNYTDAQKEKIANVMNNGVDQIFERRKAKGRGIAAMIRSRLSKIGNSRVRNRMAADANSIESAIQGVGEYDIGDMKELNDIMKDANKYEHITKHIYTDVQNGEFQRRVEKREGIVNPEEVAKRGEELQMQQQQQNEQDMDEVNDIKNEIEENEA